MRKLSFKLGSLFLIFVLLLESMLFFFLYLSVTSERVDSETNNLLARGMNHRDVLEKNFNETTVEHVSLMESEADTMVVITDEQFNIIDSSHEVNDKMVALIEKGKTMDFTHHGILVEYRWQTEPYLATISPINVNDLKRGYVYMFAETAPIRNMIQNITTLFVVVGIIAIIASIITIFFLSKFIAQPLIKMKEATGQLSMGDHNVMLDTYRNDELGELAKSIQTLSEELKHLKTERIEFLSSVSHELRTPLTYLKGYADILDREYLSQGERKKYTKIIQEEATNLSEMVKDLFFLAKIDQNQFTIQKERVRLYNFLQDIMNKFIPVFHERNIQLTLTCDKEVIAWIDPIRFKQVIHNLLDNALKYANESTMVQIVVKKQVERLNLTINDQGQGIPKADIPFVWDRLYRVEKSRSRLTGGSGLGLAIVKEIVERHGGTVEVKSLEGKSTSFIITLPQEG